MLKILAGRNLSPCSSLYFQNPPLELKSGSVLNQGPAEQVAQDTSSWVWSISTDGDTRDWVLLLEDVGT